MRNAQWRGDGNEGETGLGGTIRQPTGGRAVFQGWGKRAVFSIGEPVAGTPGGGFDNRRRGVVGGWKTEGMADRMKKRKRVLAWIIAAYSLAGIAGWVLFFGAMSLDWRPRWETPEVVHGVPPTAAQGFPGGGMHGAVLP